MLPSPTLLRKAEGRKVKAALVEDDPVPQYNAANNTSIIKAGTPRRIPRLGQFFLVRLGLKASPSRSIFGLSPPSSGQWGYPSYLRQ
jgi:hypothetical protein